jgi:hypothetical protein
MLLTAESREQWTKRTHSDSLRHRLRFDRPSANSTTTAAWAWHLYKGGSVGLTENVTLTRSDLISFTN